MEWIPTISPRGGDLIGKDAEQLWKHLHILRGGGVWNGLLDYWDESELWIIGREEVIEGWAEWGLIAATSTKSANKHKKEED